MLSILPDAVVTTTTRPVTINVLANDAGDALTITSFSKPSNGSLVFNADKTFTYTPAEGFVGDDGFSYTVRDGQGTPASIEVTISVLPDDDITAATDDIVEVVAAGDVIIPVLANDMVAGDGSLQISAVSVPGYGAVNVLPDQTIRYVPQRGFVGIDSFNYTVTDGQGSSASATVTVKVVASSSAPLAVSDTFTIEAGATTILAILSNDSDPDGGPLQVVGFTMPSHGELAFNPDKTFTYTPDAGYQGPDQFNYTIRDSQGASAAASVALDIVETAESAVALDDRFTTTAGAPVTVDVLANDILPAEQSIMIVAVTLPFKGRLTFNPDKTIIYTPNAGFVGIDDFTYTIGNGKGDTSKATVTVDVMAVSSVDVYPNGYAYRRRLVLPAQSANETTVNDTVMLFAEKASWLKSVANGGKVVSPEGADLRFELTDGTKLDHEIELYDAEAGELLAWIRLPSWTLGEPLELSLFYGNPGQSTGEAQPTGVWRGYLARWRLPSGADATGQGHDLVPQGVAVGSLLGSAARFDGNANLTLAEANWLNDLSALTVQVLVKPDAAILGTTSGILVHGSPDSALWSNGLRLHYLAETSAGTPRVVNFSVRCTDGAAFTLSSGDQHTVERRFIHGTWQSGSAPALYFDGIPDTPSRSEASAGTTLPISGPLFVGDGWQGLIDEVRIADRALPAEWIAVEARNMLDPKLSYGFGDEETSDTVDLPPIAVPFAVSTTSDKRVDIDVLGQAFDPDGVDDLLLTSVGQPLHGIATVVNNIVRYTPKAGSVGTDQFTYTISNGAKNTSGWIAVTVATATDSPSTPQTDTGVELPAAGRTVNVSNNSQLTSALSNAQPNDHIVLANGSYSSFNMTRSGTQENPIVIRAANILGAVFPGYQINGNDVTCYGLDSTGGVAVGNASSAARFKFWRCRIRNGGSQAIRLYTAPDFDGAYSQIGPGWQGRGFLFRASTSPRPVWRYSMFRDSAAGNTGNDGEAMHYSFGPSAQNSAGLVELCKFKNWSFSDEEELISNKCSGNIFRQLTVDNCPGQSVNNRYGRGNRYEAIWTDGSAGIGVHDGCDNAPNLVLGCRVDNVQGPSRSGIMVRAGQWPGCVDNAALAAGNNGASLATVVAGCTGPIWVGRTYSNSTEPAVRTRIRQHSGSIDYQLHSETDAQPGVAETLYTWAPLIWLEDSDVGPFANL